MLRQIIITFIIVFFLHVTVHAELSPEQLSFSTLLSSAMVVVNGKVNQVKVENDQYLMHFEIKNSIKGTIDPQTITIISPLANGFYLPDEAYLEKGDTYFLLFLTMINNEWRIVNGVNGVFSTDLKDDIQTVIQAFNENTKSFSKTQIKNIFHDLIHEDIKIKILYDLEKYISKNDVSFLKTLFSDTNEKVKIFSISKFGRFRVESMREEIEHLLQNNDDEEIEFHCLVALGDLGNSKSYKIIIPYLSHLKSSMKRAAIEACGKIKGNEIIKPLKALYKTEQDILNRMSCIDTICQLSNKVAVKETLQFFQSIETNSILLSILKRRLMNIS